MPRKYFIWGFPGVGKSSQGSELQIEDADCERFKYLLPGGLPPADLHRQHAWEYILPNPSYPHNYLDYINTLDADIVLLNCHISLLKTLDRDSLLLVYPSEALKEEYLQRYIQRGDHKSYLQYMDGAFKEIISAVRKSPYKKFEISEPNVYLQDLLNGGVLMNQFITKKELTQLIDECIKLEVFKPEGSVVGKSSEELAQMAFEGTLTADIGELRKSLEERKFELEHQQLLDKRRGGLSHDELKDKIMQGIVNGALTINHGEIAPYSHGFAVTFREEGLHPKHRWECYCDLPEVPEQIVCSIERDRQNQMAFSDVALRPMDIQGLLSAIKEKERERITSFVEESKAGLERRGRYSGHVASVRDVHQGLALDGIIRGHFQGDYSSITTGTQNDTVRALVALKGFCLDCIDQLPSRPLQSFVVDYLKEHGTDISTPDKLQAWIRANPDKCGLPENRNRKPALSDRILSASERTAETKGSEGLSNGHER